MTILAFAASNSRSSINKTLVTHATQLLDTDVEIIDLNDYEMPIYSIDRERAEGIPTEAQQFYNKIGQAEGLLISFAEHNGGVTAAYKNIFDWASRIDQQVYQDKPAVLLSTSPGPRGGQGALAMAKGSAPYFAMDVKAALSVPNFYDNFDMEGGQIKNEDIQVQLESALATLNEGNKHNEKS